LITFDELAELIRREMRGEFPKDVVLTEDTSLDDLGLSSLQIAEIVFTLEERIGTEFDPAKAASVKTIGKMIELTNETAAAKVH
jgi:acyl carrier protein